MTAHSNPSPTPLDASCRLPLFTLFGGAALWLVLSSFFGVTASLTFHNPAMFADCAASSFGRAFPAWGHLLVYGFAIPMGLGVGLWLLVRLGGAPVARPMLITIGAKLWHCGVLIGLVAILSGQNSGFEWFELPRVAAVVLFFAFLLMAIWVFVTYTRRSGKGLYPSQWFVLAALFWFPWIFSTAILLLQVYPVRGVVQASVAWWFAGNLLNVWLVLVGLAAAFYFLPKLTGRPLHSHFLALFVFWTVLLFGAWTGIPIHSPLPAWMGTLSSVGSGLMIIPALAILVMLIGTGRSENRCGGGPLCYTKFGVVSLLVAMLASALAGCPAIARVTDFTWFTNGVAALRLYGFFSMVMFAAAYYILPRIAGAPLSAGRIKLHFWLAMPGAVLFAFPLLGAGIAQGLKLSKGSVPFAESAQAFLMWFRIGTLGEVLIAVGALVFLVNTCGVMLSYYRGVAKAAYAEITALQPTEVKS